MTQGSSAYDTLLNLTFNVFLLIINFYLLSSHHRSIQQVIRTSNPLSITRSRAKASLTIKQRNKRLLRQRTIETPTTSSICLVIYKQTCHVKESTQFKKAVAVHAVNMLYISEKCSYIKTPFIADKPIVGQVITALGKTWHPEHFTCNHCNQELGTRNCMTPTTWTVWFRFILMRFHFFQTIVFEREGMPYCEPDYHNLFSPRCKIWSIIVLTK